MGSESRCSRYLFKTKQVGDLYMHICISVYLYLYMLGGTPGTCSRGRWAIFISVYLYLYLYLDMLDGLRELVLQVPVQQGGGLSLSIYL